MICANFCKNTTITCWFNVIVLVYFSTEVQKNILIAQIKFKKNYLTSNSPVMMVLPE